MFARPSDDAGACRRQLRRGTQVRLAHPRHLAVVLAVLAAVVVAVAASGDADAAGLDIRADATFGGVLQAAGLLFFAFAG